MTNDHGFLTIQSERGGEVEEIYKYLTTLENAYNNLYAFDTFLLETKNTYTDSKNPPTHRGRSRQSLSLNSVNFIISPTDKLQLTSVVIQSPGFWEFLGSLNPLEVIRKYLTDRHEHRKDRQYREALEQEKLSLENEITRTKVVQDRVNLLRGLGVPDDQILQMIVTYVYTPLEQLDKFQDTGLILTASIRPSDRLIEKQS